MNVICCLQDGVSRSTICSGGEVLPIGRHSPQTQSIQAQYTDRTIPYSLIQGSAVHCDTVQGRAVQHCTGVSPLGSAALNFTHCDAAYIAGWMYLWPRVSFKWHSALVSVADGVCRPKRLFQMAQFSVSIGGGVCRVQFTAAQMLLSNGTIQHCRRCLPTAVPLVTCLQPYSVHGIAFFLCTACITDWAWIVWCPLMCALGGLLVLHFGSRDG